VRRNLTAPRSLLVATLALAVSWLGTTRIAFATDLADEADLHFRLGNERVNAGDYRQALVHYLLSNRLAPNKNVVFNIASMYEELGQYPDAYRYYVEALAAETDPGRKSSLDAALTRILPRIAVVHVTSDPPGATIFVNRRDLGPRGVTPQTLAFAPGEYRILLSARGYHDNESGTIQASAGSTARVALHLEQVLGRVVIEASSPGLTVRAAELGLAPTPLPATLALPPGEHLLSVEGPLHDKQPLRVAVAAGASSRLTADPPRKRGSVLVLGSHRGAVIVVDGQPKAFVPAVLDLPVGRHVITVSQDGYRNESFEVDVVPRVQRQLEVALSPLDRVVAASRQIEEVDDAPGSVSLIPSWELRAMQYPTILEALRGVRGVFVGDDRTYAHVGVRGFARPGDYGNRLVVLLDGHPLNDNYLGSSYVGLDARTDLEDLERIEVVRGAGSVLYGTGALSGVVNLVTRWGDEPERVRVSMSTVDAGLMRANARASVRLGERSGAWVSVAGVQGQGREFEFPEYAQDGADGRSRGLDGLEAGTIGGRVWSGPATVQWFLHTRKKTIPTGAYDTLFPDSRNVVQDTRAALEAKVETGVARGLDVFHRAYVNGYHFESTRPYAPEDGGLALDDFVGVWAGLEERVAWQIGDRWRVTVGGEAQRHVRARQFGEDDDQVYLDRDDPYTVLAGYVLLDADPHERVRLSLGNRVDWFSSFGLAVTPRGAFNWQPYEAGRVKLMGGKAFRAPSVFELHFNDGGLTQVASPDLAPESSIYGELELSHRFTPAVTALLAGYVTSYSNLIVALGDGTEESPSYFENSEADVLATGVEAEVRREWREGWAMSGSYTYQRLRYVGDTAGLREVPNTPQHLASLKLTVPLLARALRASNRLSVEGPRFDRNETDEDPPQSRVGGSVTWDSVLSTSTVIGAATWSFSAGVYNAFDRRQSIPLSREYRQLSIVQAGRTVLLSVAASL